MNDTNIVAVILSGGAGKRFEGADKGLYPHQGKPLIQWVIDAIAPQVCGLLLCVNRNLNEYQTLGYPLISDQSDKREGPLAGLIAAIDFIENTDFIEGLYSSKTKDSSKTKIDPGQISTILLSSCDSPNLPNNYVGLLNEAMQANQALAVVVNDGQRNQNLHCLIHKDAWEIVRQFFTEGGRAMHRLHKTIGTIEVDFSDQADAFLNINSPDQLTE